MGESKWKLPDFKSKIPDFRQQAENKMKSIMDPSNFPDFMAIASQKMSSLKSQVENPNVDDITALVDKLDTAKNISHVAKALGINVQEDQIRKILDKKLELENAAMEKSFGAVSSFMKKEGYKVDPPEKMLSNITSQMQKGEDPIDIFKSTAKPFTDFVKDSLDGSNKVSINVDLSSMKEKVSREAAEKLTNSNLEEKVTSFGASIGDLATKAENIKLPKIDISQDKIQAEVEKRASEFKIDPSIPDHIKKLMETYKITGGN